MEFELHLFYIKMKQKYRMILMTLAGIIIGGGISYLIEPKVSLFSTGLLSLLMIILLWFEIYTDSRREDETKT
jgi:putative Ca2+/H+ antiporter (TMEM165/GDT1 family)